MRFYRITFVGGLAIGYVLGAQAGRERYEQLKRLARKAADSPAMQQTAGAIQAQASATARSARTKAATGVRKGTAKASGRRSEPASSGTRARAGDGTSPRASRARGTGPARGTQSARGTGPARGTDSDGHRPFAPVHGNVGDRDLGPYPA